MANFTDKFNQIVDGRDNLVCQRNQLILQLKRMSSELEEGVLKQCIDTLFQVHTECEKASEAVLVFTQESVKKIESKVFIECSYLPLNNKNLVTISFSHLSNDYDELLVLLDEFLPYKSEISTKESLVYFFPPMLDFKHIGMTIAKDFLNKSKDVTLLFKEDGKSIPVEII